MFRAEPNESCEIRLASITVTSLGLVLSVVLGTGCAPTPTSPTRQLIVRVDPALSEESALTTSTPEVMGQQSERMEPLTITADSEDEELLHLKVLRHGTEYLYVDELWLNVKSSAPGASRAEMKGLQESDGVMSGCTNVGGTVVINSAELPSHQASAPLIVRYELVGDCYGSEGESSQTVRLTSADIRKSQ